MSTQTHWTDEYKDAPWSTLAGRIWRAACYTIGYPEERVRAIGQISFGQGLCIWHAAWIEGGSQGLCHCSPCRKSRGEK